MASGVRFGLIGAGRWGKNYIRTLASLKERCELTHLCTSNPENAKLIDHPVAVVSQWRQLVEGPCDAVIISSPSATHAEILEACLNARKPCIVEKPCFLDLPTAQRLCERIQRENHRVLVEYTQLFNPTYRALRQRLRASKEPIRLIVSEGANLGPFRNEESALWDWCPHDLSLILDLMQAKPQGFEILAGARDKRGIAEQLAMRLDFPSQTTAWIQAGYLSPQKRRQLHVFTDEYLYSFDDCAAQRLTVCAFAFPRRYETPNAALESRSLPVSDVTPPLTAAVVYFLDALAGGEQSLCEISMTLAITQILSECEWRVLPHHG